MREEVRYKDALNIITNYKAPQPLSRYLQTMFSRNRKFGSRDRRELRHLVFNYFRTGSAIPGVDAGTRLIIGNYLCTGEETAFLKYWLPRKTSLQPETIKSSLEEKLTLLERVYNFHLEDVFPFYEELSPEIDRQAFTQSFFIRPRVYMRIHPKFRNAVTTEMAYKKVKYEEPEPGLISVKPETRLTDLKTSKKGYFEIQDYNSQQTIHEIPVGKDERWWDCCAGSGGKSLLMKSKFPGIDLYASDIRSSILRNLEERFYKAGVSAHVLNINLENPVDRDLPLMDGILIDAPCSGSGTWSRTPERLTTFTKGEISNFRDRQLNIAANVLPFLRKNGNLVYITCSVFRAENEDVVSQLAREHGLETVRLHYLKGYDKRAETLFLAVLKKH